MISRSLAVLGLVLLIAGCSAPEKAPSASEEARAEPALPEGHPPLGDAATAPGAMESGEVLEAIGASSYTYLRVDTGQGEKWLAAPAFDVEVGNRVVWAPGTPMQGWHSETLDRTWDQVDFIGQIHVQGEGAEAPAMPPGHPPVAAPAGDASGGAVAKLEGGLTVAEIHSRAGELAGQRVALRGRVVKANFGILGSNWLHLKDGSGSAASGSDDLTVTTDGRAAVGDVVVVKGVLATDKDFGAGYAYAVIVENADVAVEASAR